MEKRRKLGLGADAPLDDGTGDAGDDPISAEMARLEGEMRAAAANVPRPPGIESIKTFGRHEWPPR